MLAAKRLMPPIPGDVRSGPGEGALLCIYWLSVLLKPHVVDCVSQLGHEVIDVGTPTTRRWTSLS